LVQPELRREGIQDNSFSFSLSGGLPHYNNFGRGRKPDYVNDKLDPPTKKIARPRQQRALSLGLARIIYFAGPSNFSLTYPCQNYSALYNLEERKRGKQKQGGKIMKQLELFKDFKGREIRSMGAVINRDFGLPEKRMKKQEELFPGWWEEIIRTKERNAKGKEVEISSEDPKMISWIKNPTIRVKVYKLNSDLKWVEKEIITRAVINTNGQSYYKFNDRAKTEIIEWEDMRRKNEDLTSLIENDYEDAGISHYDPPAVDMDRGHFNEMCTSNKTHILAFYEKNHLDFKKDWWMSEEWLIESLGISYKHAQKLAYAFERLDLDRKAVIRLMHGYISDTEIRRIMNKKSWKDKEFQEGKHYKEGMKDMSDRIYEFIDYVSELADELPELKKNDVHSGETNVGDPETLDWVQEATRMLNKEVPDKKEYEDRFNLSKDTIFGTHKLFYGEEGCSHELLSYINECNQEELNDMKKAMFPQKTFWGNTKRAEYWYLTPSQKSQAWRYIKDRQEELNEANTIRIGG
jgi:hypothetical protein